ncbi:MAG: thioredoxin-disulfide reductase [Actinomycetota bacterium]|nr:thioredoxin-disulfide reductase [Actinomycetota bacterium]
MEEIKKDLVIIGAGPAGLGAAVYAYRAGLDFAITDKFSAGGQIITTEHIDNYPGFYEDISGYDLMQKMIEHIKKFGVAVQEFCEIKNIAGKKKISKKNKKEILKEYICESEDKRFFTNTIIMATGAGPKKLGAENEEKFIGKGISFCATCDGALYRDMEIAVVGGGNAAIEEALFLTKFASKVYIVHRRDELRASKRVQEKAFVNPKIEFLLSSEILRFEGGDRIEQIVLKNKKTNSTDEIKIAGVFEYVGIVPNSSILSGLADMDENAFLITDKNLQTSAEGVFAAGDVRDTPLKQVISAVADGALAATSAEKYIAGFLNNKS